MRDNPTGGFIPPKDTVEGYAWHEARKRSTTPPSPPLSYPQPPVRHSPRRSPPKSGNAGKRSDGGGGAVGGIIGLFLLLTLLSTCGG